MDDLHVVLRKPAEALAHEPDERILASPVVARQDRADEPDPLVSERDQVLQPHHDAGLVVDVDAREFERARALPQRDDRNRPVAQVGQERRLVLHVTEHHDRVAMPRLEDGGQSQPLVDTAVRVTEHDVVAAAIASTASASMAVAKNGSLKSRTTAPMSIVDAPRRPRARGFGR